MPLLSFSKMEVIRKKREVKGQSCLSKALSQLERSLPSVRPISLPFCLRPLYSRAAMLLICLTYRLVTIVHACVSSSEVHWGTVPGFL